jgi:amino-acid N-acetyltransferase
MESKVMVRVRNATVADARAICGLIREYAEHDKMLFRSMADIYENIQTFLVAEADGKVVGCGALQVIWSDLAEIKSLAVKKARVGTGVGKAIVLGALEKAGILGIGRVFALTLEPGFFGKLGFEAVEKNSLPMKVWSDCAKCPKQQHCDETAVIISLNS